MAFELPPLPFDKAALEPHMSAKTLEFHHGKHHAAYVKTLNELIEGTPLEKKSLDEIIVESAKDQSKATIFNNAAQVWNHTFFWNCLRKGGGGKPAGDIAKKIDSDLGGYDKFAEEFRKAGSTQFGSGWAWLVLDKEKLKVIKTPNAVNPLSQGQIALLTVDVWEHAYYLDYQNRRPDFIKTFLEHLVNWDYVQRNLEARHALAH
ncbi:MAG TPA: superoxide dismutase [Stellaceae bacterium]|nr:superoxide dismutase [Stellaceae bacterium]